MSFCLITILFPMSHKVCRLPLYTKYETLGNPALNGLIAILDSYGFIIDYKFY